MNDLINGRTPEEIVEANRHCSRCFCDECAYFNAIECQTDLKRDCADLIKHLEAKQPKWISVKDRLPESGVHVFVCCENTGSLGSKIRYICDGFYAGKYKVKADWYDDDSAVEYSEEDDEYYFEEGWYEVIKNWGDYNSVVIDDCPTHWMPLPEPPEEER